MERSDVTLNIIDGAIELEIGRRKRRIGFDNLVPVFSIEHRGVENTLEVVPELTLDRGLL